MKTAFEEYNQIVASIPKEVHAEVDIAFIVVGIGAFVQGTVIQEKCMMLGGAFSMIAGAFITGCLLSGTTMLIWWVNPLFALSFVTMFIVPGYVIRNKALRDERA